MFGIGPMEMLVIAVAAMIFIGPKRLPELMRNFAKFYVQAKRYSNEFRESVTSVVKEAEDELRLEEAKNIKAQIAKNLEALKPDLSIDTDMANAVQAHDPNDGFVTLEDLEKGPKWEPPKEPQPLADTASTPVAPSSEPKKS